MNFNQLDNEQKNQLHKQTMELAENLGGINFFLQMIEDIKKIEDGHYYSQQN